MIRLTKPVYFLLFLALSWNNGFADSTPLQKINLQLQWKHQFEFAGFYAAKEKGFYREAGLDVNLIEFDENKDPINQVLNGQAE